MASIIQRSPGSWQAKVRRDGLPIQSKTFSKKSEAELWARNIEHALDNGTFVSPAAAEGMTFKQAAEKYEQEILPSKRGASKEIYRLRNLVSEFGSYSLAALSSAPGILADFRDRRLAQLSAQSVVHEINLLQRILKAAEMDFGITLPRGVPKIRKPRIANARERRLVDGEEQRLMAAINERTNNAIASIVTLAIETAARQSEILSLEWNLIDLDRRVARLRGESGRETKNNDPYRDVPLSSKAIAVLAKTPEKKRKGPVFTITQNNLKQTYTRSINAARRNYEREVFEARLRDAGLSDSEIKDELTKVLPRGGPRQFRQPPLPITESIRCDLAQDPMLKDLTFHDLRHEATSRLAEKFQIHELMKITGHKGATMLARYYHPRAEDLAKRLD